MRYILPLGLIFAAASSLANAQSLKGHNSDAPVDVDADRIEIQDRSDRAIFSGNVRVKQAGLTLSSARLTVAYAKGGGSDVAIERLDATGGVVVTSATETARGDIAIYDLPRRLITMLGAVTLVQRQNQIRGGRLVIDLTTGRAVVDGNAVGTPGTTTQKAGGRVSGRFTVKSDGKPQ